MKPESTKKTTERIKEMYRRWPILIGNDDWTYAQILQEDGFRGLEDIAKMRVTRFKTVDRACRLARQQLGITSKMRKEKEIECKRYFANNKG